MDKEQRIFELKKDVWTPAGYWRAGSKRTFSEWVDCFGDIASWDIDDWFIDTSKPKEERKKDLVNIIVDEVFKEKNLHSITYKEAAALVAKQYHREMQEQAKAANKLPH